MALMDNPKVFVVMPFSNEVANSNYSHTIKPLCDTFNLEVTRADEIFSTSPIYDDIVKEIQESSIVIVDITDRNPNVFYELGMAHTLKQNRTIMVTQDGHKDLPFDIAHFRILHYIDSINGKAKFERELKSTMKNLLSDRKENFKNEFKLTFDILLSSKDKHKLFGLVGIKKYKGTLTRFARVSMEGKTPKGESESNSHSIENLFLTMQELGHIKYENDIIGLTEKGNAFVNFLIERDVDCYRFNDQIFEKDYMPFTEKLRIKQQRS